MNSAPADPLHSIPTLRGVHAPHTTNVQPFSVVIPCHNEAQGLTQLATATERLRSELGRHCELELLLVDDGSTDETWNLMRQHFGDRTDVTLLRHETNRGIAAAIATGLAHARADVVASLDADCTYDPLILVPMRQLLKDDVDLVVASPYHPSGNVEGVAAWRLALSRMASRLYRVVLRNKLHTYTSCVRVYRRNSVIELPLGNGGFVGVVELVWQLDRMGGKIVEHPAVLRVRKTGQSKMRVARTTCDHLRLLSRAARQRLFGRVPRFARPVPCAADHLGKSSHLRTKSRDFAS
jgi:dolichol-phosphate mannosyltransferase